MAHAVLDPGQSPRKAQRLRTLKSAKLLLNNMSVVDCGVRDLSATGAKLECKDPVAIPSTFRFVLTTERTMRDAKVVWRKGDMIGIHFTSAPVPAPARKF